MNWIETAAHLFWSSWRRQTKKDGWNLQESGVFSNGENVPLHRRHTFFDAVAAMAFSSATPPDDSILIPVLIHPLSLLFSSRFFFLRFFLSRNNNTP